MDGAGTISGRWSLAAGRAGIKGCRICSGPTLPGTRLCTQCKAALKRARQETVSELIPPPSRSAARAAARSRKSRASGEAAPQRTLSDARSWRGAAVVLAAIAAAGVGYVVLHFLRTAPSPTSIVRAEPAPAPPQGVAPVAPSPSLRAEPVALPPTLAKEAAPSAVTVSPPKAAVPRSAPKRVAESPPEPTPAPAVARFAAATEPPTPAPSPEPVPAPRPAPPRDRWQLMTDAIAQCGREGFFAGVVCEQRLRLQYCDGYWGQVAQCPSGIPNDHGD